MKALKGGTEEKQLLDRCVRELNAQQDHLSGLRGAYIEVLRCLHRPHSLHPVGVDLSRSGSLGRNRYKQALHLRHQDFVFPSPR